MKRKRLIWSQSRGEGKARLSCMPRRHPGGKGILKGGSSSCGEGVVLGGGDLMIGGENGKRSFSNAK